MRHTALLAALILAAGSAAAKPKKKTDDSAQSQPQEQSEPSKLDKVKQGLSSVGSFFGGLHGGSNATTTQNTHTSDSKSEEHSTRVNGKELESSKHTSRKSSDEHKGMDLRRGRIESSKHEESEEMTEEKHAGKARPEQGEKGFRDACRYNDECASGHCYVYREGNTGYCTRMCESWTDCPTFWQCERALNTAQKLCKQPKD